MPSRGTGQFDVAGLGCQLLLRGVVASVRERRGFKGIFLIAEVIAQLDSQATLVAGV